VSAGSLEVSMAAIQKRAYENGGVHLLAKGKGPKTASGAVDMAEVELVVIQRDPGSVVAHRGTRIGV
jgi:hypothetical protein